MDIIAIIEGLISSVPEAVSLWNKVVPLVAPAAGVSDAQVAAVAALAPEAHAAVAVAGQAINALIAAHSATPAAPVTTAPASAS
jgi:hypothetical protein